MPLRLLALSGSQRAASWSTALLEATRALAPADVLVQVFEEHKGWPLFNPDMESDPPPSVRALREGLNAADALLIASPEYAHGVTGTIKNTLDWLVSEPAFAGKPVAVLNPSHRAHHADEALKETLRTMAADLVPAACLRIPVIGANVAQGEIGTVPAFRDAILATFDAIREHVARGRQAWPGE